MQEDETLQVAAQMQQNLSPMQCMMLMGGNNGGFGNNMMNTMMLQSMMGGQMQSPLAVNPFIPNSASSSSGFVHQGQHPWPPPMPQQTRQFTPMSTGCYPTPESSPRAYVQDTSQAGGMTAEEKARQALTALEGLLKDAQDGSDTSAAQSEAIAKRISGIFGKDKPVKTEPGKDEEDFETKISNSRSFQDLRAHLFDMNDKVEDLTNTVTTRLGEQDKVSAQIFQKLEAIAQNTSTGATVAQASTKTESLDKGLKMVESMESMADREQALRSFIPGEIDWAEVKFDPYMHTYLLSGDVFGICSSRADRKTIFGGGNVLDFETWGSKILGFKCRRQWACKASALGVPKVLFNKDCDGNVEGDLSMLLKIITCHLMWTSRLDAVKSFSRDGILPSTKSPKWS